MYKMLIQPKILEIFFFVLKICKNLKQFYLIINFQFYALILAFDTTVVIFRLLKLLYDLKLTVL